MTTDAMAHLTTGAVVVYLLNWIKNAGWFPWLSHDTGAINRVVSMIAAGAMAFGISATGDAQSGWVIHVPSLDLLLAGGYEWLKQFCSQQLIFDIVPRFKQKPEPKLAIPPVGAV